LPIATIPLSIQPVQPVIDISISNLHFPPFRHHSYDQKQLRHSQQQTTTRSQSLSPSQFHFLRSTQQKTISNHIQPPIAVVPPSPKKSLPSLPSLQITLTRDTNEKNLSSKVKRSNAKTISSLKSLNETTNNEYKNSFRPSATVIVGGSRSAFRPFLKSTTFNPQPRIPYNINVRSQISTNQSIQT
jgi:hypothetical protein